MDNKMKLNLNVYSFNLFNVKINIIGILAFSILVGFIFAKTGNAASFQLSGKVLDSFNIPIVNANIDVIKLDSNIIVAHTVSDINGYYNIIVDGGTYIIKITSLTNNDQRSEITFKQTIFKDMVLNIILVSSSSEKIEKDFYNLITNPLYR